MFYVLENTLEITWNSNHKNRNLLQEQKLTYFAYFNKVLVD